MATLPDLNTDNISFVGYWNAIDKGGVESFDPENLLTYNNLDSYTLFDNGWEGTVIDSGLWGGYGKSRPINIRAKTDGWVVAYIDRTRTTGTQETNADLLNGPWDIIKGWTRADVANPITNNVLATTIDKIMQEDGSIVTQPDPADVDLYNYETPTAKYITQMKEYVGSDTGERSFLYSSGTEVKDAFLVVTPDSKPVYWNGKQQGLGTDGVRINDSDDHAAIDLLASDYIPDPDTEYYIYYDNRNGSNTAAGHLLTMWG